MLDTFQTLQVIKNLIALIFKFGSISYKTVTIVKISLHHSQFSIINMKIPTRLNYEFFLRR